MRHLSRFHGVYSLGTAQHENVKGDDYIKGKTETEHSGFC